MSFRKINDEVFIANDLMVNISLEEVNFLKQQAYKSPRKRARICAHKVDDDSLHEMVIAISEGCYIRPHRHIQKTESFHVIEGEVDLVLFDNDGKLSKVVQLAAVGTGRCFFHRLSESVFHCLLIRSEHLIIHEVTNGPFDRNRTELASFAPAEELESEVRSYTRSLSDKVSRYLKGENW